MKHIGFFFLCFVVAGSWGCRPDDTGDATQPAKDSATPAVKAADPTPDPQRVAPPTDKATPATSAAAAAKLTGQDPGPVTEDPQNELLLLGSFRSREYTVHVYTGQRYTIETADGEIVGELLTKEEFAKRHPKLLAEFRGAIADDASLFGGRINNY